MAHSPFSSDGRPRPDYGHEAAFSGVVCGIDEAGRGPLAGPVVAAAVILNPDNLPVGLDDSKRLSAAKREALAVTLTGCAHIGIGEADVAEIDRVNILNATMNAMARAVAALPVAPACALVDGNRAPTLPCDTRTIVKGDAKCLSIAAASIIAKVTRDKIMTALAATYPAYNWAQNAGYGTAAHLSAIATHGVTIHHRRSFAPVRDALAREDNQSRHNLDLANPQN